MLDLVEGLNDMLCGSTMRFESGVLMSVVTRVDVEEPRGCIARKEDSYSECKSRWTAECKEEKQLWTRSQGVWW